MRAADVASLLVLAGLTVQSIGLYAIIGGVGMMLAVLGTEVALLGLVGVFNAR